MKKSTSIRLAWKIHYSIRAYKDNSTLEFNYNTLEIIKYIFNNLDENNNFFGSYSEIMEQFSISKPTLIKLFKDLADKNILIKISHKTYQFDEKSLND